MSDYDGILLENIWHELKAVREGQEAMASVPGDIARLKDDMFEVKGDIRAIKAVLKDHSKILNTHSRLLRGHSAQITELRQAVRLIY